jgi:predicted ribosomally synthesized peptide with SipW-like signal peptide
MNVKIALSGLSILTALSLVGAGTFAYFSDVGTSTANAFSSGTLNMVLSDSEETDQENVIASFGGTNLTPGICLPIATLNIKNATGSIAANHIDVAATNTDAAFAAFLKLNTITFDGIGVIVPDSNLNGFSDLQDLATNGITNKSLTDINVNHPLVMEVCLDVSATNAQQGLTDTVGLTVTLDQGPHL